MYRMSKKERFRIYIAAYLILVKGKQILLLRRAHTGYQDGNYSLIAGHLNGGETATQCTIREAKEEAGITLHPDDLEVIHVMHRNSPEREYIDIYLRAHIWKGEIKNIEPEKCDELKWYSLDSLPENIILEVKLALENTQKNIFYSEIGW